jgi:hypothetical protein
MIVRRLTQFAASLVVAGMVVVPHAQAQDAFLGDVNADGTTSVFDVQAAIAQALGAAEQTVQANVDENEQVDILDVTHIINTVLGTGGLVQKVTANIQTDVEGDKKIVAVSHDGLLVESDVDPETGEVTLDLRVNSGWSFALVVQAEDGGAETVVGTVEFPLEGEPSATLPLPTLSNGNAVDFGNLTFDGPVAIGAHVKDALKGVTPPVDTSDDDGDGIPDFLEPLLEGIEDLPIPGNPSAQDLEDEIAACLQDILPIEDPDLTDANEDGVPDFLEPVLECVAEAIEQYLQAEGTPVPPADSDGNGIPDMIDGYIAELEADIPEWIDEIDAPFLEDANGNHIPDFVEAFISTRGKPGRIDKEGNGVPDFAQDDDGDGIPNIADEDSRRPNDSDGDGIPDFADVDDDNDGIPDYAEQD